MTTSAFKNGSMDDSDYYEEFSEDSGESEDEADIASRNVKAMN